ncbi:Uncharacterized protein Fot_14581 [Forsythia ovata]|uniref:Uncharacterized protein n=1 Tax=Forsythia ovata TaxID=205694 RepID=A0ABD1W951_9LAMI
MDRIAKIESNQSEIEAKQAEILSFQWDLKSRLNKLSGNVQSMIADFLNYMDKKFHSNTEDVVLNMQIVLYSPILETLVQVENNDGSQLKDFEVESQVQYDRKGKAVVCDKTNKESIHYGATEFENKAVIREIRSGTSVLRDEINDVDVNDIVDFEEWLNIGLCKNNK